MQGKIGDWAARPRGLGYAAARCGSRSRGLRAATPRRRMRQVVGEPYPLRLEINDNRSALAAVYRCWRVEQNPAYRPQACTVEDCFFIWPSCLSYFPKPARVADTVETCYVLPCVARAQPQAVFTSAGRSLAPYPASLFLLFWRYSVCPVLAAVTDRRPNTRSAPIGRKARVVRGLPGYRQWRSFGWRRGRQSRLRRRRASAIHRRCRFATGR